MAFTGYAIPGFTVIGEVSPAIRELAVTFNLEAINALNMPVEEDLKWASEISGVTPAIFRGKVPIDFTALDGYEPFKGTRTYKQIDVAAVQADVQPWQRNLEWDIRLGAAGAEIQGIYNMADKAQAMIAHARVMQARLAASVLMQGTPSVGTALVYAGNSIPGAGHPLFYTAHLANPMDASSRTFSNYHTAVGKFNATTFALTRQNMRLIPSPALSAETLGVQVTDIIGGSIMEEPFRQMYLANLYLQTQTVGGAAVGAAVTNIYAAGSTPCKYWIAPQLDADPYYTANAGKQMWIAVSRKLVGARCIEMVAPTKEFTPQLQLFGNGTELAALTRKIHLVSDLDAGAAAALPHVVARYEET
jgi:hypothetical protein